MISGLNNSTIDANTVSNGSVKGAHKRPDPEDLFKKMDADSDGSVSEQEFESTMVSISPQGATAADSADAQARAAAEFKKTDSNGDGKISESELAAGMKAHEAQHQGQTQEAGGSAASRGAPPTAGAGGGSAPSQAPSASSSSGQNYDPADTNKDGKVSEQEAQAYAAKEAAQNAATAAIKSYDEISTLSGTQAGQAAE